MLCLALGITLARWLTVPVIPLIGLTVLLSAAALLLSKRRGGSPLIHAALICAGTILYTISLPPDNFSPCRATVTGRIVEPPVIAGSHIYFPIKITTLEADSLPAITTSGFLRVRSGVNGENLTAGNEIRLWGRISPLQPKQNPADFDYRAWSRRNGYIGELACDSLTVPSPAIPLTYRLTNRIRLTVQTLFGGDAPLMNALLLGIRQQIAVSLLDNFRLTGLSHLLALSGLHIGFLVVIALGIGMLLRLSIGRRTLLVLVILTLYLTLIPLRAGTLRSAIMVAVLLTAPLLKKHTSGMNLLAVAGIVILLIRPGDLFDAGAQLSFAALVGLIIAKPLTETLHYRIKERFGMWGRRVSKWLLVPFVFSTCATAFTLPLTAYHFGMTAWGAPLFNLFAIPFLALIYASGWMALALYSVWTAGGLITAEGVNILIYFFHQTINLFALAAPVSRAHPAPVTVILLFSALFLLAYTRQWRRRITALLIVSAALIWDVTRIIPDKPQIWLLDVGHGDAQVWRFPEGRTIIVDGGPVPFGRLKGYVADQLTYWQVKKVDMAVMTHTDSDHFSGLTDVVREFPVEAALRGTAGTPSASYTRLCSLMTAGGIEWKTGTDGALIRGLTERYRLTVCNPPRDSTFASDNNNSVGLRLTILFPDGDSLSYLTIGDIETEGEEYLLTRNHLLESELFKASHHGSRTSNSPSFLDEVRPRMVAITRGNRYEGSLSRELIRYLDSRKIETHFTDKEGALLFEPEYTSRGWRWKCVNWRDPGFAAWFFGR